MLYLADYLEPGRRHHDADRAALIERVPEAPGDALRAVVAARMGWALTSHWSVAPETVELWNALAA
jgi:HD superfamily phosphohydrolase YqeK